MLIVEKILVEEEPVPEKSTESIEDLLDKLEKDFDDYVEGGHYVNTKGQDLSSQKTLGGDLIANLEQEDKDKIKDSVWKVFKPQAEKYLTQHPETKFDKFIYGDKTKGIPSLKDIWRDEVNKFNDNFLGRSSLDQVYGKIKGTKARMNFIRDLINNPKYKNSDGTKTLNYYFLTKNLDEVYNNDKDLAKSFILKYITLLGNGKELSRCKAHLAQLDPDTLYTWVKSMGEALKDKDNIFIQFMNGPSSYFDKKVAKQDFISAYNVIAALESWGKQDEMNKFLTRDDQPLGNKAIYQNVKNDEDKIYLLKYAFGKPGRTAAIFNSIDNNSWRVFINQVKLELKGIATAEKLAKNDKDISKNKSFGDAVKNLIDKLDTTDPEAIKKAFKDKLGITLTDDQVKKIINKKGIVI